MLHVDCAGADHIARTAWDGIMTNAGGGVAIPERGGMSRLMREMASSSELGDVPMRALRGSIVDDAHQTVAMQHLPPTLALMRA